MTFAAIAPSASTSSVVSKRYLRTFDALSDAVELTPEDRERHVLDAVRPLVSTEELLFLTRVSIEPAFGALRGERQGAG